MQVGIVPVLNNRNAAIYQASYNLLTALYHLETRHKFIVFAEDHFSLGFLGDERDGWRTRPMEPYSVRGLLQKYFRRLARVEPSETIWNPVLPQKTPADFGEEEEEEEVFDADVINYRPERGRWFARSGADLMIYPAPSVLSFEAGVPYIVAIRDLKFKLHEQYPQLLREGESQAYEYMIRNVIRYADLILVDSEAAKEDILLYGRAIGITGEVIQVVPAVPALYMDEEVSEEEVRRVSLKYGLNDPYILCPGAFWPHKNHDRLVEAVDLLRSECKLPVHLFLCGPSTGRIRKDRFQEIVDLVHDRDLEGRVHCVGFVPNHEMAALYSGARAVADLTLFGSSSFVVQEAWAFDRAVVASRIRGIRDQVGDAWILVDPLNVEDIAEGIRKLWTEPATRAQFVERGRLRHASFSLADFSSRLVKVLDDAELRMESDTES